MSAYTPNLNGSKIAEFETYNGNVIKQKDTALGIRQEGKKEEGKKTVKELTINGQLMGLHHTNISNDKW